MPKQIIIAEQHQIAAVFSEDQIQELVVATGHHQIGDVYLGVVENVLPGIDAAFVNIGDPERNGFIHVTDLGPLKLKRTAAAITELLAPQQKVLVQVMKEPTGTKGPRLTGNITSPGRYVVLMPYGRGVNLSRRIKSESERNRLRALAILIKPAGMGLLVRTEAEGKPEEAIIEDLELLQKQWEAIQQEANSTRAPALLNRDDDFIQRVLRDMYGADVNRIVVDSSSGLKRVKQYLQNWSGGQTPQGVLFDHHRDRSPILEYFRISAAIKEALKPRVDLPSGGYIIIEPTEALTVVDVNSGSFTRSATARETVLWTNCEAATEIARQLRLRNIAGVIVVDFIDMESRRDQLQVLEHFNKALKADKARPQIAQLTELGLVELTRKRQGQNIYELFGETCPACGGLGHIMHLPGEKDSRTRGDISTSPGVLPKTNDVPDRFDIGYSPSKVSLVPKEPRLPVNRITEPRENYDAFGDVFDGDSDLGNFDSINHPSYQEPRDSKRRVRKSSHNRVGINGVTRKDETGVNISPLDFDNDPDLEGDVSPLRQNSVSTDLDKGTGDIVGSNLGKLGWNERGERSGSFDSEQFNPTLTRTPKVTKVEPIKPVVEPPEVKTVEMTLEEQDVFALMGVSPLVKLDQEVKASKSVIINIVGPGHLGSKEPDLSDRDEVEESTDKPQTPTTNTVELSLENLSQENTIQVVSDEKPVLKNTTEDAGLEVKKEISNRRRRRRSSAVESDSSGEDDN